VFRQGLRDTDSGASVGSTGRRKSSAAAQPGELGGGAGLANQKWTPTSYPETERDCGAKPCTIVSIIVLPRNTDKMPEIPENPKSQAH